MSHLSPSTTTPPDRHNPTANASDHQLRQATVEDEDTAIKNTLPPIYHDFTDVFRKSEADKLPEHRPYDHRIPIQPGQNPPFGPVYSLTNGEHEALKAYLEDMLAKGFIRPSSSSAGSPLLFVAKPDGSLRPCIDYRRLNEITIKDKYTIPKPDDLFDRLRGSTIFSKIDLRGAYNLLRIALGEEWKTAFRTRYGSFEYLVMPFGLCNAPSTFQRFINDIFRDMVDVFIVVYLDDILIFSRNASDHERHVKQVLERLRQHQLYAKAEKCEFHKDSVEFLGYQITTTGITMVQNKVDSLLSWPTPTNVKELQSFLGFANFYRRFIWKYSTLITPLTTLLRKDAKWIWTDKCQSAFDSLKTAFTTAPILQHYDPNKPITLETDASDYAIAAVASQPDNDGQLHPIGFRSRKMTAAELNYDIHDKEMLAIVDTLKDWRHLLQDTLHTVTIYTDHKNLEYFTTSKLLNRRQARWAELLPDYDFKIIYRPGSLGGKPDALTRRPDYHPGTSHEKYLANNPHNERILLPNDKHTFDSTEYSRASATYILSDPNLHDKYLRAYDSDPESQAILAHLQQEITPSKKRQKKQNHKNKEQEQEQPKEQQNITRNTSLLPLSLLQHFSLSPSNLILFKTQLYIPTPLRLDILKNRHDHQLAGHPGRKKTLKLIQRDYFWPSMRQHVHDYVDTCDLCSRTKAPRHKPYGFLKSLPVPDRPWSSISMDLIETLPLSNGFDSILVIVDRLTKMSLFIPTHTSMTAPDLAQLYLQHVFSKHGCPDTIISDRGSEFTSSFWRSLCQLLGIKQSLSTAFRPQTDGQTERTNQTLEQYLRIYTDYQQSNWSQLLPLAEFAYNNSEHEAIKTTPFVANKGFHPLFDLAPRQESNTGTDNPHHPLASELIDTLSLTHQELVKHITHANETSARAYNKTHMEPPTFNIGDMVMLSTRNIKTTRPTKKLDYRFIGPYKILDKISSHAYRLQLPATMRIHNVFHVSLLEPHKPNTLADRTQPPPPAIKIDGNLEYEVERVVDSKIDRRYSCTLRYLIEWSGYTGEDRFTWEPADELECHAHIRDFHARHPDKPGPLAPTSTTTP